MAVHLFKKIKREEVDILPFISDKYLFGYVDNSNNSRMGVFYEMNEENHGRAERLLLGKSDYKITKGDRVFVLTGCKIPLYKIKDHLKKTGAVITGDISDSTVMIGNKRVSQFCIRSQDCLDNYSMLLKLEVNRIPDELNELSNIKIDDVVEQYPELVEKQIRGMNLFYRGKVYGNCLEIKIVFGITPYAANILYSILAKKIVTISDNFFAKSLPGVSVLDRDACDQIHRMLDSGNEENERVACEMLANCDYSDSELYLYKLSRD